ncbi:MAG: 23S rRNA (guanosine(2251)-2'-O)-methyltransferase RlmB, partial [Actinobacteria bacterium]|nr:23S rRNA (guanosine(2251)-2'-O)-methyltransferase RlmB [Actinomycetota bacterium]
HRAVHITPTVAKAAAGAIEYLPMAIVAGIPTALAELSEHAVWVVGLDADGPTSVDALAVADQAVALVLGSEGRGLGRLVRQRCEVLAAIPQHGHLDSLSVASAAAVACMAVARQRAG